MSILFCPKEEYFFKTPWWNKGILHTNRTTKIGWRISSYNVEILLHICVLAIQCILIFCVHTLVLSWISVSAYIFIEVWKWCHKTYSSGSTVQCDRRKNFWKLPEKQISAMGICMLIRDSGFVVGCRGKPYTIKVVFRFSLAQMNILCICHCVIFNFHKTKLHFSFENVSTN